MEEREEAYRRLVEPRRAELLRASFPAFGLPEALAA
jgi:hypothetical protein